MFITHSNNSTTDNRRNTKEQINDLSTRAPMVSIADGDPASPKTTENMFNDKTPIDMEEKNDVKYLRLLSQSFPTVAAASTEIINLQAILNLPKGTEHFLADVHGEHEAFRHVLKNASGNIRRKVNDLFGNTLRE